MPSTYNGLKDTVLYCQRHFEDVLKDARVVFTSERAGKVLDEWMDLVVKSAGEIRNFYAKSPLGERTFSDSMAQNPQMLQTSWRKGSGRPKATVWTIYDNN